MNGDLKLAFAIGLAVLVFVGVKMCIADLYKINFEISLTFIVFTLGISLYASMILQK